MKFDTVKEATMHWVETFNAIPMGIIEKIIKDDDCFDELVEVTPPAVGDEVLCDGELGTILKSDEDKYYLVKLRDSGDNVWLHDGEFETLSIDRDYLPMWGTMWAFGDNIDNDWLSGEFGTNGLQLMADCGFRIYEQEDYGYIFGIDGAGYDFYESHWIPLYKARGLHWHKQDDEEDGGHGEA